MSDTNYQQCRHRWASTVMLGEVDRQNIVHNAAYLYWLETARVEYFRAIGIPMDQQTFITKHLYVVARQELDYVNPAMFDDRYTVYTRSSFIGDTSFGFEQSIVLDDGRAAIHCKAVLVHLDPATRRPATIPKAVRDLVTAYEAGKEG